MTTNEKVQFLARKRGWSYGQIVAMLGIAQGTAGVRALLVAGQNPALTDPAPGTAVGRRARIIGLKRRWLSNGDIALLTGVPLATIVAFLADPTIDPAAEGAPA